MGAPDQSTNEVVIVVEVTANLGAYVDLLKSNYIIPTLEYFNNGPVDKTDFGYDYGSTQYALVLFHTADCAPEPASTCLAPTTSAQKVLSWFNNIQFIGGAGEGFSHIAEGLSTAVQVFDDFKTLRDPNAIVQKHCILVCNSPPYQIPSMESPTYSNYLAEQLATLMSERIINLSIISPRKIPVLYKLYEMAGGDPQLPLSKSFAQDRRHLVLLKGYQLKQRPVSPTPPTSGSLASTAPEKIDIKSAVTLPVNVQVNMKKVSPIDTSVQNQMKPPAATQPANVIGLQGQQGQPMMGMAGQMKPRIPTPITSFTSLAPPTTTAVPVIVTVNPNMSTFTSSTTTPINQGMNQIMGVKTSTTFPHQNDMRNPVSNAPVSIVGARWSQPQQTALNTTAGQPITIQAQSMPLLTNRLMQQPPLIGPGQARMTVAQQQKNQAVNQTSISAATNQPVMVATVSAASLQSQLNATKAPMPVASIPGGNINVLHQQQQQQQGAQPTLTMQNIGASQAQLSATTSTVSIASQPNLSAQTASNIPHQQIQPAAPMHPAQRQQKDLVMIWQGSLEWKQDKVKSDNPNDQNKGMRSNMCRISCYVINGEPEIAAEKWPSVLFMQMMPRQLLSSVGQLFFTNAKTVTFHFTDPDSETIQSLNKLMSTGYVGCVHLSTRGAPQTPIKVIMLIYSAEKNTHVGLIPKDQSNFVAAIRRVITSSQRKVQDQAKQKMMQMSGGSVATGTPTAPNNLQLAAAPTATNQQGIILAQQANPMNVNAPPQPQMAGLQQAPQQQQQQQPPPQQQQQPQQPSQQPQAPPQPGQQIPTNQQLEAERQQNLLQIQQLQQTLEAARQKELQFKAAQDRQHALTQLQQQQQQQQQQPRMAQLQQVPQNAANNPQLRHLLQQQAQQQQARHPNQQQQQHLLLQQQQQQLQQQQQQQQQQQHQAPVPPQMQPGTVNTQPQPAFVNDVDNLMDFLS